MKSQQKNNVSTKVTPKYHFLGNGLDCGDDHIMTRRFHSFPRSGPEPLEILWNEGFFHGQILCDRRHLPHCLGSFGKGDGKNIQITSWCQLISWKLLTWNKRALGFHYCFNFNIYYSASTIPTGYLDVCPSTGAIGTEQHLALESAQVLKNRLFLRMKSMVREESEGRWNRSVLTLGCCNTNALRFAMFSEVVLKLCFWGKGS